MIVDAIFSFLVIVLGGIFDVLHLPIITTLPTVNGFDIDTALAGGIADLHTYITAVWPLYDLWIAFLLFLGWKALLMLLRFLLGNRAPSVS